MESESWGGRERRRFQRVSFQAVAFLDVPAGQHEGDVLDMSLKGALFRPSKPWEGAVGEKCRLAVPLREGEEVIQMEGEITHFRDGCLGIKCREIDLDSITSLRRLVELNLGDEALLQRELSALVGAG